MEKITGKNNDMIKGVKKLLASSSLRSSQGLFVLEGARLVFDVLNSAYEVKYFLATENAYSKYKSSCDALINKSEGSYFISEDIADKLSETKSSQGIFAVCKIKDNNLNINKSGKYIALDNVQDPGNLGAILRSAEALGIDGVIIGGGCDVYNPKVLRASMGSVLRIAYKQTDDLLQELISLKENGILIYSTSPSDKAEKITDVDFNGGVISVIGNEANGVSDEVMSISDKIITIPMLGRAESLNASIACAITMWEMLR